MGTGIEIIFYQYPAQLFISIWVKEDIEIIEKASQWRGLLKITHVESDQISDFQDFISKWQ